MALDKILKYFPVNIKRALEHNLSPELREIRLRVDRPLIILEKSEAFLRADGSKTSLPNSAYIATAEDCRIFFNNITGHSIYALEQQLAQLYITLDGGIRVGLTGSTSVEKGRIKLVKSCMHFNIRIPHQIKDCSLNVLNGISKTDRVYSTLIVSPPGAGKTTLLRDVARHLSSKSTLNVCIVDERSEIASCYDGIPQFDIGLRTDVLDNSPKAESIGKLIRVMAPDVIITDEIGGPEDCNAIVEAINCGIAVIASVHADSLDQALKRQALQGITGAFERFIVLSRRKGAGTLEGIYDNDMRNLFGRTAVRLSAISQ